MQWGQPLIAQGFLLNEDNKQDEQFALDENFFISRQAQANYAFA